MTPSFTLTRTFQRAIKVAPIIMMSVCAVFLMNPVTRSATLWMLKENHPVELLTFAVALAAGLLGLALAWRAGKGGEKAFVIGFYAMFAAALIFLAMEEVAWGQQFFGFASPESWQAINAQGETTLHNIVGAQGHSEIFRLLFGFAGLIGIWLASNPKLRKIGPPMMLLPWFAVITLHAGIDVYNDYFAIARQFDFNMQRTSELVELLIALSGLLYIVLMSQLFLVTSREGHATAKPRPSYTSPR